MMKPDDDITEETPATPKRLGKRGTFRSLTAAEYARETGRALIAFPMGNVALTGPRKPFTPDVTRQVNVYHRLLGFAQSGECTPLLPPHPAPQSAKERRLEKHWDAMWEWAVSNGATGIMSWLPDDHSPLSVYRREWVRRMEREIPRWTERLATADTDLQSDQLTDDERVLLARKLASTTDWTHSDAVHALAWWRSYGDL